MERRANPPEDYPRTVAEAVDWLESVLPDGDKKKLAAMAEDDLIGLHFGLGLFIRNSLQVWSNKALMKDAGVSHEDDVSAAIIEALWRKLRQDGRSEKKK